MQTTTTEEDIQRQKENIQKKQEQPKYYFVKYRDPDKGRKIGKRFKHISLAREFALKKWRNDTFLTFTNQNRTRLTL